MRIWLALLVAASGLNADAAEDRQTIHFKNGDAYQFTANTEGGTGTREWTVTSNGQPAIVESFDGKKLYREEGTISCKEIAYNKQDDRLSCGNTSMASVFVSHYRANPSQLVVEKAERIEIVEADEPQRTTTLYQRKQ